MMDLSSRASDLSRPGRMHNVGTNERRLSLLGGAAALIGGLYRGGMPGMVLSGVGAALLYRGATGYCPVSASLGRNTAQPNEPGLFEIGTARRAQARRPAVMRAGVVINRSPQELYEHWRDFSRLPQFMRYIIEVRAAGENRWHWVAELPLVGRLEWDAEITADVPGERLAWRTVEGSDIHTEGEVDFRSHPEAGGSDVQVEMRYLSEGPLSRIASKMGLSEQMLKEDLRRFKQLMETGEIARSSATDLPAPSTRLQ